MSKLMMDFALSQSPSETIATSASPQPIADDCRNWRSISRSCGSELWPTLGAAMVACLLVQIFTLVSIASAQEEFGLIGAETPACENCAQSNSAPAFEQAHVAMNYDSTGFQQGNVIESDFGQVDYGQGFNSGVELVNYDSQYPVQDYGQAISAGEYAQDFGAMEVQQFPLDQTYTSYQEIPSVTQNQSYGQAFQASTGSGQVQPGLAQQKAVQAAQSGVRGHLGGGLGGAKYEGVGWSNHSAQNAINSCCYWGVRPTAQIGVSKGNDGFWYACVLYH